MNKIERVFLFDCNDNIVGNPKGYKNFTSARIQAESKYSKTYNEIWKRFYNKYPDNNHEGETIYSSKLLTIGV